ncbi:MAG: hypothetical protein KBH07_03745 [Flavobacteriales bacterium]|nr:hypothetical protein [Flavobacteriales bacterium]MBP9079146.1 hypothetical protein [Flavobacteriales bacterium]
MNQAPLPQDRFEALEAYVLGRMDAAQRQRIEMDLAADADLNSELALQREHIRAVEMAGVERQLNLLARQQPDRIRSTATGWHSWLKYAALVAVLILGAVWWYGRPPVNERLFAEYHVPDPGLPVPMSATKDPLFQDAMVAYKLGDHAEAIGKWTGLLQQDPANDTLLFFIASARLAQGDAPASIPLFRRVKDNSASVFQAKAGWYLFLAFLHEGRTDDLRALGLEHDPVYGDRARAVEERLDP